MDPSAPEERFAPVNMAALSLLETYDDILHDIFGNPEERPMVITKDQKNRFLTSLSTFYEQVKACGVPIAHSDLRPYSGEPARGAVEALSNKLVSCGLLLNLARDGDPQYFSSLLDGLSADAWMKLVRDQAASPASSRWPPREHDSVTVESLSEMERNQVGAFLRAGPGQVLEVSKIARLARWADSPNRHDKEAARDLDLKGITEKVGRTGRRLIAVPKGMSTGRA